MGAIFVSHAATDRAIAEELARRLRQQGHRSIFVDSDESGEELAEPGLRRRNWEKELFTQLRTANAVIALCTQASSRSRHCFAELALARALGKPIFAVKAEDCELDPVLSDQPPIDLTSDAEAYPRLWRRFVLAGLDPKTPVHFDSARPPYPGLAGFEEEDAAVFFGREAEVQESMETVSRMQRTGGTKLALLLGPSGVGKSSLLRAGILARLRREPDRWLVLGPLRGLSLKELGAAFSRAFQAREQPRYPSEVIRELRKPTTKPGGSLAALATELLSTAMNPSVTLVIVIDQLEASLLDEPPDPELDDPAPLASARTTAPTIPVTGPTTMPPPLAGPGATMPGTGKPIVRGTHDEAFAALALALESPESPILVVAALRSDYLSELQSHPIAGRLAFETLSIGPVHTLEWPHLVEGPAQRVGLELDIGLVQVIGASAEASDLLPDLAYTLRELWERDRAGGKLMLDTYARVLGGVDGAVRRAAERALEQRPLAPGDAAVFTQLLRTGDGAKYQTAAVKWESLNQRERARMEDFLAARLLISRGEERERTVELAHESILRSWPRLKDWLEAPREFTKWKGWLADKRAEWIAASKSPRALLMGFELWDAHRRRKSNPDALAPEDHDLIDRSLNLTLAIAGVAAALFVLLLLFL